MGEQGADQARDGGAEVERSGASPVAALAALPKLLGGALEDIRTIASGMQMLPELARILWTIEERVESLDEEVRKMRQAVEAMGGDVGELPPKIDDLGHALHPLRRMGSRFGRGRDGGAAEAGQPSEAGSASQPD